MSKQTHIAISNEEYIQLRMMAERYRWMRTSVLASEDDELQAGIERYSANHAEPTDELSFDVYVDGLRAAFPHPAEPPTTEVSDVTGIGDNIVIALTLNEAVAISMLPPSGVVATDGFVAGQIVGVARKLRDQHSELETLQFEKWTDIGQPDFELRDDGYKQ